MYLSNCLSACLSVCLSICLSVCLSVCVFHLSLCHVTLVCAHCHTHTHTCTCAYTHTLAYTRTMHVCTSIIILSQRGGSPFVHRDRAGWPASLPYICKIRVSVAMGTQSEIRLHKRVATVKLWGSSKNDRNWTTVKLFKLHFHNSFSPCCSSSSSSSVSTSVSQ